MTRLIFAFICFFIIGNAAAQATLTFCVMVDKNGECITPSNQFDINSDGGTISFLVKNDGALQTRRLRYKIYLLDDRGNETLSKTFDQITGKDWTYAWQDISFFDAGTYKVKVYEEDEHESFLCSETLKIFKP